MSSNTAPIHINKDPSDVLVLGRNWTAFLDGDTIATSTWAAEAGLTVDSESETATQTSVQISGGTAGSVYRLTNTITLTTSGETINRSIIVTVKEL